MRLSKVREKSPHPVVQVVLIAKKCPPHTHAHAYTYIYIHVYIYTHTQKQVFCCEMLYKSTEHRKEVGCSRIASLYKKKDKNLVMARVEFPFGTKHLHNLLITPNGFALKGQREEALRCTDCLKHTKNWKVILHPAFQVSATVLDE